MHIMKNHTDAYTDTYGSVSAGREKCMRKHIMRKHRDAKQFSKHKTYEEAY